MNQTMSALKKPASVICMILAYVISKLDHEISQNYWTL